MPPSAAAAPVPSYAFSLATARLIKREMAKLRKRHGVVTPELLVEAARPPASPLHRFFEWNDSAAAEKFRLLQASHMVRRVMVMVETSTGLRPVRAFVSIRREGQRSYDELQVALGEPSSRDQFLNQLRMDLESVIRRYETYEFCAESIGLVRRALVALD